jgi:hypothetical protein
MGFRHLPSDSYQTRSVGALEFFLRNGVIRIFDCLVFASGKAGGVRSIFISLSSFARFIVFLLLVSPIHSQIAYTLQVVFHLEKYQKNRLSLELSRSLYQRYLLVFVRPVGTPSGVGKVGEQGKTTWARNHSRGREKDKVR